jgi:hypothetical protein
MKIQFAPLSSNISIDNQLTLPWFAWFSSISKNLENACRTFEMVNYTYTINNNILAIMYQGQGNESLALPYIVVVDTFLTYIKKENDMWVTYVLDIPKGSQTVYIPSGDIQIKDFLIVSQQNK